MYREWQQSPHAHTSGSALYRAARATADASCDRCHEPLRTLGADVEFARAEGVGCDVCHRIERVEIRPDGALAPLLAVGTTKYGPRCDPHRPYFHKAECSPIFVKSEFCAACHLLSVPGPNGQLLPIHTEYDDWLMGPYAARGRSCQSCHMLPGVSAELATGESKRDGVPDHGFWGRQAELRGTGLAARARAAWKGAQLTLAVNVRNAAAGHFMPAGAPGQQVILRVIVLGSSGEELARADRAFERRLLDSAGNVANSSTASRVGHDTRIAPLTSRDERFAFPTPNAHVARIVLVRRHDPELAALLGVSASPEEEISQLSILVRSGRGARRIDSRAGRLLP